MNQELPDIVYTPESQLPTLRKLFGQHVVDLKVCHFLVWPIDGQPALSVKDKQGQLFTKADYFDDPIVTPFLHGEGRGEGN